MKNTIDIGKEEMFKIIRELYDKYKLPRLNISQNEWSSFFNVLGSYFDNDELRDDYPIALNLIIRRAFNLALVDSSKELTIDYIIDALKDITVFHIYSEKVTKIQNSIREKIEEANNKKGFTKKITTN